MTHTEVAKAPRSSNPPTDNDAKIYLIGGGIASMAAAAFLIRDGDAIGRNITILEESGVIGGSLDGSGSAEKGYVLRGGRMFESKYLCTFELFSSIPTLVGRETVAQEILAWNETMKTSSKSRLMVDGHREVAPKFGLSEKHILTIERLALEPEAALGRGRIVDQFDPSFFKTDFWLMWCTTFAFQPWHGAVEFKRYLVRFAHMVEGFDRLKGILRTVYNQYDSLVRPLRKSLDEHGVVFVMNTTITDLVIVETAGVKNVETVVFRRGGQIGEIAVSRSDRVIVTLGSMTEGSSLGSMDTAPAFNGKTSGGAWALWEAIAAKGPEYGNPSVFSDDADHSKWVSFTITLNDPRLLRIVRDLTGNVPGEGGLITFSKSSWLASIVIPHQPHFIGQPEGVSVLWGYGLSVDEPGDFIKKPMSACTGREIMTEVLGHLGVRDELAEILENAICIPCMMPFITSQFMPRQRGDRPDVIPKGSQNLAFIGQFCEQPEDVVFTVEYSIRSAQTAVYGLLGLNRKPPPVYHGKFDPRVLYHAFRALHDEVA
jgi:oleate hydratase